jgi:hypothetical protein
LSVGDTVTVDIQWDTTEQQQHVLDYIGTYNKTNPADPCSGVTGCSLVTNVVTAPIPIDTRVTAAGVNSQPADGLFYVFGAQAGSVSVSSYSYTGPADFSDTTKAGLSVTFTSAVNGTVVIAWSGHISTRLDWGINLSAISLPGSPYHMRILGTGNQDRSMSVAGIVYPAIVTIVKVANPYTPPNNSSNELFAYTASANFGVVGNQFTLQDNNNNGDGNPDFITQNVTDFVNPITITEAAKSGWQIGNLACVDSNGGLGFTANSTPQAPGVANQATATILVQEGEYVTCTYTNVQQTPSAAPASIGGRIVDSMDRGLKGVTLTLTDLESGTYRTATTNTYGYYQFDEVETTRFYSLTVSSKKYMFRDDTVYFTLNEDSFGMNFVAADGR